MKDYRSIVTTMINHNKTTDTIFNLYQRYLDEGKYEDWNEYSKIIGTLTPEGMTFLKATKRPFGLKMESECGKTVAVFVKRKGVNVVMAAKVV